MSAARTGSFADESFWQIAPSAGHRRLKRPKKCEGWRSGAEGCKAMRGAKQEATPPTSVQTRHHFSPEASLDEGGVIAAKHLLLNEGNPDGPCGAEPGGRRLCPCGKGPEKRPPRQLCGSILPAYSSNQGPCLDCSWWSLAPGDVAAQRGEVRHGRRKRDLVSELPRG